VWEVGFATVTAVIRMAGSVLMMVNDKGGRESRRVQADGLF
jgi:hypothetical protein